MMVLRDSVSLHQQKCHLSPRVRYCAIIFPTAFVVNMNFTHQQLVSIGKVLITQSMKGIQSFLEVISICTIILVLV